MHITHDRAESLLLAILLLNASNGLLIQRAKSIFIPCKEAL